MKTQNRHMGISQGNPIIDPTCLRNIRRHIGRIRPPTEESVLTEARQAFEELVCFCLGEERTFNRETFYWYSCSAWGCVVTRLMLVHRHSRLSLEPYLAMKEAIG